jgi:uncharacterized integral membrane protein
MFRFAICIAAVIVANVSTVGVVSLSAALIGLVVGVAGIVSDVREFRREARRIEAKYGR